MKVIIAGSRNIKSYDIQTAVHKSGFPVTEVVTGECRGVDLLGLAWAISKGIPSARFPVTPTEWDTLGRKAGPLRNEKMAVYADALILIWDGKSKGSANMLKNAKRFNLKIHEEIEK